MLSQLWVLHLHLMEISIKRFEKLRGQQNQQSTFGIGPQHPPIPNVANPISQPLFGSNETVFVIIVTKVFCRGTTLINSIHFATQFSGW